MKTLVSFLFVLNAIVLGFNLVCFGFFGAPLCGIAALASACVAISVVNADAIERGIA